jgi:hypothetical protein
MKSLDIKAFAFVAGAAVLHTVRISGRKLFVFNRLLFATGAEAGARGAGVADSGGKS